MLTSYGNQQKTNPHSISKLFCSYGSMSVNIARRNQNFSQVYNPLSFSLLTDCRGGEHKRCQGLQFSVSTLVFVASKY